MREIGVALGIAVLTAVFTGAGGQLTPSGYVDAAVPAVFVGAVVVLATAIVGLFLPAGRALYAPVVGHRTSETNEQLAAEAEPVGV